ncbi:hypothetical protein E2C01_025327 [Portunus trituberculatus]|uniref:Uncharacterized protein n=1 Tax=Portunus trituberculatus TaxID=210409 RepID=A0A5B7EF72_PORTR|nr:hypothetical protein [Portunus trituberculatus]
MDIGSCELLGVVQHTCDQRNIVAVSLDTAAVLCSAVPSKYQVPCVPTVCPDPPKQLSLEVINN